MPAGDLRRGCENSAGRHAEEAKPTDHFTVIVEMEL